MSNRTFRNTVTKLAQAQINLRGDQSGTVAVMAAIAFPILLTTLGLGFEVSNWYLRARAMQNAADAAVIAAASDNGSNYSAEAAAVAAAYGFVDGSNNVAVATSNAATCPSEPNVSPPCYSVTITSMLPLILTEVIGYAGNAVLNGAREVRLTSAAVASPTTIKQPICLLGLDPSGQAIRSNGAPNSNFAGCTVMSNSAAGCNGSNLQATIGVAHATNNGCGVRQISYVPQVADPYAALAVNIPSDLASRCSNTYPQEWKHGGTWWGGTAWSGTMGLSGNASLDGKTLVCGDLRLAGDVTINAPNGAVLFIDNGQLDLEGHTFRTANGSAVTMVFTGTNGSYTHAPTDRTGGSTGVLDIQAPTGGPFPGVAIYQDPILTTGVNVYYAGNSPTWDITGLVYLPNASVTMSGAINKSANGADCFVMVADDITINGTGGIYQQSPNGSACKGAGLNMPTATIPGRAQLIY